MDKSDKREILSVLGEMMSFLERGFAGLTADVARLKDDVGGLKADVTQLKEGQARTEVRLMRIEDHLDVAELRARVEEQSRTIAALIPVRAAAVAADPPTRKRA